MLDLRCCCFQTFKDLLAPGPVPDFRFATRFFDRVAKVRAFIKSIKFFCHFPKIFFSIRLPESFEELVTFLKWVAKVRAFTHSTKFFHSFLITFSSGRNYFFKELPLF